MTRYTLGLLAGLAVTAAASAQQPLVMEKYTVRDPMAVHKDAVSFLMPKGWKVEGGVKWYLNMAHLACVEVRAFNPDGLEQMESFQWANFAWITNPVIPMETGTNYMGSIIMRPIEDPKEAVRTLTIPSIRKGAKIVSSQDLPDVAKALSAANGGVKVRAAKVRLEYEVGRQVVEEDIYLSIFVTSFNLGGNTVSTIWGPAWTPFGLRAKKGELDAATPMLLSMANSARVTPEWFAEYSYVCKLFEKRMYSSIENARQLSQTISRNSEEIRKMFSEAYANRQASQDRLSRQYSNYIRGVEQYHSPHERYPVQLPSGYDYVWTNPQGQYILSNQAGFNPNEGATQTWTQMKTAK